MEKKLKVLIVPDSFKGSLTAREVAESLSDGLDFFKGHLNVEVIPFADGGEGSLDVIENYTSSEQREIYTFDPFMKAIRGSYLIDRANSTAYIESAKIIGIEILDRSPDCYYSTSYGLGRILEDAIHEELHTIYLFLGGTATSDSGYGMAAALGVSFYSGKRMVERPLAKDMSHIDRIQLNDIRKNFNGTKVIVGTDVNNPLFGNDGAAFTYAAQKGASKSQIKELDLGLRKFHEICMRDYNIDLQKIKGAGAAGGLGAGTAFFLNGHIKSGFEIMADLAHLEDKIREADLIVTGEGKLDRQSFFGKTISKIKDLAIKHDKEIALVAAISDMNRDEVLDLGFKDLRTLYSAVPKNIDIEETKKRLFKVGKKWAKQLIGIDI